MINLLTVVDTLAVNEAVNVPEAISGIASLTVSDIYDAVTSFALTFVIKLVQVALIWFVGRWLGRRLINIVKAVFKKHLQEIYHARIAYPPKKNGASKRDVLVNEDTE